MPPFRMSVAFALVLVASLGCEKKDSAVPTTKESEPADPTVSPTLPTAATNTDNAGAAPLKAAAEFLKAVQDVKATSASLTSAFKKVIAPPELEADKAAGYSESGVQAWLIAAKAKVAAEDIKLDTATAEYAFGSCGRSMPGKTYLRLLKVEGAWRIDYLIFANPSAAASLPGGEQAAPAFAALAFADSFVAKDFAAFESLLTKAAKQKLAPPLFDSDEKQGYSRSKLQTVLSDASSVKLDITRLSVGVGTAKVELAGAGFQKMLDLKLAPGTGPGEFLIDDYQQK